MPVRSIDVQALRLNQHGQYSKLAFVWECEDAELDLRPSGCLISSRFTRMDVYPQNFESFANVRKPL